MSVERMTFVVNNFVNLDVFKKDHSLRELKD